MPRCNYDIEDRKLFKTHMHSQGNGGHDVNAALTDNERLAIIEYLKTLQGEPRSSGAKQMKKASRDCLLAFFSATLSTARIY